MRSRTRARWSTCPGRYPSRRPSSSTTARATLTALPLPPGSYRYPRVSPDGSRVAFDSRDNKEAFVSVYNLSGTTAPPRITFGSNNRYPIWSGDGKHVAFQSDREGAPAVFWQAIGSGSAERLTTAEPGTSHVPESWSRDGVLLYSVRKRDGGLALVAVDRGSAAEGVRRRRLAGSPDQRGVLARRRLGGVSDRGFGFVRRVDLRAAVPRDWQTSARSAAAAGRSGRATALSCSSCRRPASSGWSR